MSDMVLTGEDPEVPEDCIPNAVVRVVQYVTPEGRLGIATRCQADVPLSQTLGLLAMAGIDVYLRCDRAEPRDEP